METKRGYFLLANVLSMQPPERLHKHATLELAHHVLKAGMFKSQSKETGECLLMIFVSDLYYSLFTLGKSASEYNAQFMAGCTTHSTEALTCERNLFFPNVKVTYIIACILSISSDLSKTQTDSFPGQQTAASSRGKSECANYCVL